MKRATKLFIVFFTLMFFVSSAFASGFDIEEATKSVLKLVGFFENDSETYVTGSGFVAFKNNILVTNYHVIEGVTSMYASDDNDNVYELKYILSADKVADIAILEFEKPTNLKPLDLYPDDHLKRGSKVYAIGSPEGLKNSVTDGVVSYQYTDGNGIPEIQISAPISHGSSGGALFNEDGQVIGVTTWTISEGQNLNFAINVAVPQAMYNAWDGNKYTFANHKTTARMDYTGVYDHQSDTGDQEAIVTAIPVDNTVSASETWTCPNCGTVNSDRFCQECGTEKPSWICVCGRQNSGKFCGSCGRKAEDLILEFNQAIGLIDAHEFDKAASALEAMGQYNSGSFSTVKGTHVEASSYISEVYYQQGIYLVSIHGDHESILDCFAKAGNYEDTADQIKAENDRYYGAFYENGIDQVKDGQYLDAIASFEKAGDYSDAKEKVKSAYYLYGESLLEDKQYAASRTAFEKAGEYSDAATMILKAYYEEGSDWYNKGDYNKAIESYTNAKDYPDAKNSILKCYYAQGNEALQNSQTDKAIDFFTQAGDYEDAKDLIAKIEENENAIAYNAAMESFIAGEYELAKEEFENLSGYRDADDYAKISDIRLIRKKLDRYIEEKVYALSSYEKLSNDLAKYLDSDEAKALWKEIQYEMGVMQHKKKDFEFAMDCFANADDFSDASEQLIITAKDYCINLLQRGKYDEAYGLYHEKLIPLGYEEDFIVIEPGNNGELPAYVLSLIRVMELSWNIPKNEDTYKEAYIPAVQKLEEYFGLNADGNITLDEYFAVKDLIYKGLQGDNVQKLVEKLFDLSYLRSLTQDHTVYVDGYFSGIKSAEKALGLTVDGVVTPEEYTIILEQPVEIDKPEVKAQVNNDTVTLTWSKIPGAIIYEIYVDSGIMNAKIAETKECRWVAKNVETGTTKSYSVKAKKYTVASISDTLSVDIPKYYIPVSIAELKKNFSKYEGKYVEIKNAPFDDWVIEHGKADIFGTRERTRTYGAVSSAHRKEGYDLKILCRSSDNCVEFVLKEYKDWGWKDNNDSFAYLCFYKRIRTVSGKGVVQKGVSRQWLEEKGKKSDDPIYGTLYSAGEWRRYSEVPSILLEEVDYSYR